MKLKEKFKKQLDTATPTLNRPWYQAQKSTELADEFAVGFAEWLDINFKLNFTNNVFKDLLEIYKEEKGL